MTSKEQYEAQVSGLQAQADAYARYYGYSGAHNGAWDAFRHAYVSAEMTRVHGTFTAKVLGDLYEAKGQLGGQPWNEKNMDLWNNAAGRKMGENSHSQLDSARRVKNALDNGSLITDPAKDPRKNSSTPPHPNDKDPEVCCEDCGAAAMFPPPPPPPSPNESVYLDDGEILIIPPMTMPPFNTPVIAAMSRMELTTSDESQTEHINSVEASANITTLSASQVETTTWAEPLHANIDSAMALIAETHVDMIRVPALAADIEIAIDPMVTAWSDHREQDITVV